MKNKLLTLSATLALLAVLGKFYEAPAIAQAVRAALVNPETGERSVSTDGRTNLYGTTGLSKCITMPATSSKHRFTAIR